MKHVFPKFDFLRMHHILALVQRHAKTDIIRSGDINVLT
jgi:hypothetical protein